MQSYNSYSERDDDKLTRSQRSDANTLWRAC